MKLYFDQLVEFLGANGYSVKVTEQKEFEYSAIPNEEPKKKVVRNTYLFAFIDNNGILAGFCTANKDSYKYLNNRISADNLDCYDKWSKCPLGMNLPVDGEELLKHLKWLSSPEGYKHSLNYEYLDSRILPYDPFTCEEN